MDDSSAQPEFQLLESAEFSLFLAKRTHMVATRSFAPNPTTMASHSSTSLCGEWRARTDMTDQLDELSLDPQDWSATRSLAHEMLDQLFDDLENVRSRPPWQRLPDSAKASLCVRAPRTMSGPRPDFLPFEVSTVANLSGSTRLQSYSLREGAIKPSTAGRGTEL